MIASMLLAVTTNVAAEFFQDFGDSWICRTARYQSYWSINSPAGNYWTIVAWGADKAHLGGRAYVGWLPQTQRYVYEDFHNDGSFSQLHANAPVDHRYEWTGTYYAAGAKAPDSSGDIIWQLTPNGTIERHFAQVIDGKRVDRGSDACTRPGKLRR